jgi:hypothetical protein
MRFWKPFILGGAGTVHLAGLYYVCDKKYGWESMIFYAKWKLNSAFDVSNRLIEYGDNNSIVRDASNWLANLLSPAQSIANAKSNGSTDTLLDEFIQRVGHDIILAHLSAVLSFITFCGLAFALARWEAQRQTEDKFIRGSKLFPPKVLSGILKKQFGGGTIKIGKLTLARKQENLSMFICGKPQQGKTQLFNYLLTEIMRRQEKAIVFCAKKEDFVTSHYRPGIDWIFCPPEARTVGWSLKNDISTVEDFAVLANVLAPINLQSKDPMWDKGKQLVIKALFGHWWLATDRSNKELARIAKSTQAELASILKSTPGYEEAYGLISNPKSQTAYGFYVNVLCDLQPLQLLSKNEGEFSIRSWLRDGKNCIFLPCSDRLEASLSPLYGMFLELMAINQMDMEQDRMRRVFWLVDELPAIARIAKLPSLVNKGPSYGACFCGGAQSIIQLDTRYSEPERRAILNSCATTVIFCVEDDKTAEELSKRIGSDEREKTKENLSTASVESRDGVTVMSETKKEPLVTPDMLRDLPPMNFYVRVAGFGTAERQVMKYVKPKMLNPDFIPHPAYSLEAFELEYKQKMEEARACLSKINSQEKPEVEFSVSHSSEDRQEQENEEAMQMLISQDDGIEV